jgi:transcriptional regulator with XRE-family HTH domain
VGTINHALNEALEEEHKKRGLTQTAMAEDLQTDKSFVCRKMNGTSNMTLETLADLAYALDRVVEVQLLSRTPAPGSNNGSFISAAAPQSGLLMTNTRSISPSGPSNLSVYWKAAEPA